MSLIMQVWSQVYWAGWVKSRLRRLITSLEKVPGVASLQPLPHALKGAVAELCCSFYVGIGLAPPSAPAATTTTTADGADVAAAAGDETAPRYDEIAARLMQ